jgi:hypothetical protein
MKIVYSLNVAVSFPAILFSIRSMISEILKVNRTQLKGKIYFILIGVVLCCLGTVFALFISSVSVITDLFVSLFGCIIFQLMPLMVSINRDSINY